MDIYLEGFIFKGFKFAWKDKILFRLPTTKNNRYYPIKEVPVIWLSDTGQGFRLIRHKKSIAQVRSMTKKVKWKIEKNCEECL